MGTKKAKLVLPKLETRKVWAGMYGGHYSVIVFFKEKPKLSKKPFHLSNIINGKYYDLYDNKALTIGAMWLPDFERLYPNANVGKPTNIEITKVFQLELEGVYNEFGRLTTLVYVDAEGF
jgi:hypothetical protein